MGRKKPISEPSAFVRAQRPAQAPDMNRSNSRIDELEAQRQWEFHAQNCRGQFEHANHIAAGRIEVR